MPFYDFECTACKGVIEDVLLQISERDEYPKKNKCPSCGKQKLVHLMGCPSFLYDSLVSPHKRAGDGWKEVQDKIKAGSGRNNTIRTK